MSNRLSDETSPYLLQHADNPVDWYPWGAEALEAAQAEDKPILLSVGYSACHWCHVMERESFEDEAIAAQMNADFINVKVDREERPDVDELYMRAVQAFNEGRGGWPMTVFLTPTGEPFFGGTYFPPEARGSTPGLPDILTHVAHLWRDRRGDVERLTKEVIALLQRSGSMPAPAQVLSNDWLDPVLVSASAEFDEDNGGFGDAPKFPPHATLKALLAHHHRTGSSASLELVTATLDGMARGGMYDLLGGGFARYSVDAAWRVPHFEKMLYDNAQLLCLYVDAWRLTQRAPYARIVRETLGWALREMRLEHRGFAASQDADSDGVEGAFFVWTPEQIADVLGDEAPQLAALLGVTEEGTFEHGTSVLRLEQPPESLPDDLRSALEAALPRLFVARETRNRPGRDDKVITSWNALMISALARAAVALKEPEWTIAAVQAAEFLLSSCVVDGRLMRTYKDGRAHVPAYADDHVNLAAAMLDLWEATFDPRWVDQALAMSDRIVSLFWDEERGGLFYTGSDQPQLVQRSKHFLGGAEPSANGVAALTFLRLARLCGRPDLADKAQQIVLSAQQLLSGAPRALGDEALAGAWLAHGGLEIAVIGDRSDPLTAQMIEAVHGTHLPFAVVYAGDTPDADRMPWLSGKVALAGRPTAYVCEGYTCKLPVHDAASLLAQLEESRTRAPAPTPTPDRPLAPALPTDPERWIGADPPPSLEALRGQIVVLDFWSYCCVNCHHVLPELAALQDRYGEHGVSVIGVHSAKFDAEQLRGNVEVAVARHNVHHPVVLDEAHALWESYGVRSWPTLVFLDATGRVATTRPGEIKLEELSSIVDELLTEAGLPIPAPAEAPGEEAEPAEPRALRFPGKLHVWPNAWDQELGAAVYPGGRVYVTDSGNHRILECSLSRDSDGWPTLTLERTFGEGLPGLRDGAAAEARFRNPQGTCRFEDTLYVADTDNHALRAIDLSTGEVRTLAGTGACGTGAPDREQMADAASVELRSPWAVEVMPFKHHHLVFIAMAGSHQIWVYAQGHVGIHAGSSREDHVDGPAAAAALAQPSDLALYGRYLLFVDSEVSSIRAVDLQAHQVVTVVGRGLFDFGDVDGNAEVARLQHPLGLTFAGERVFVADTYNHKIKQIALANGETRTLAGGDGALREPSGLARAGEFLLIADTSHHALAALRISDGALRPLPLQ